MGYHLLTGATGLLGHYLLYDFIRQGVPLAVVVRGTRMATAHQRIDDSLAVWEKRLGRSLPRPVVLTGDLGKPNLGLSGSELNWIKDNCSAAIHNAASLTFVAESREEEPYRSNVGGTQALLDVCRQTGIRQYHHVSTAYICGLREGRILESESDVGQTLGNDYEISKLEAEKLVRAADFLDQVTVFRPGIIIGDSQTGYTSTFHGFYVPLKVAYGFAESARMQESVDLSTLIQLFGMSLTDRKNLVPVDWVSAAMAHIIARPNLHGQCYHLIPPEATPLKDIGEVIRDCLDAAQLGPNPSRQSRHRPSDATLEQLFALMESQMSVYKAYWRDDPRFDRTNTLLALKQLPCPEVDRAMLKRTCEYAVRCGFGWPKAPLRRADWRVADHLQSLTSSADLTKITERDTVSINLRVSGLGGGQWNLARLGNVITQWSEGPSHAAKGEIYLSAGTLRRLIEGSVDPRIAIQQGDVLAKGQEDGQEILKSLIGQPSMA